ncbi:MAG: restriction endonuclease [Cyanobacteriota bacterium]|nr:restriction endonuclease [Cyanobacteriota bacterium]
MNNNQLNNSLDIILHKYSQSFASKIFTQESLEADDLMLVFGLNQEIKARNKQYWGRELGMCWERIVKEICRQTCDDFHEAIRDGNDELCDFVVGLDAIDTKYRIGSGDSGTLKKFRQYAARLNAIEYNHVLLILRNDNLPQAINACSMGGWQVISGNNTFNYINQTTGFDLKLWLQSRINLYSIG